MIRINTPLIILLCLHNIIIRGINYIIRCRRDLILERVSSHFESIKVCETSSGVMIPISYDFWKQNIFYLVSIMAMNFLQDGLVMKT